MLDLLDPIEMGRVLWPEVKFYRQQREIIYSVVYSPETFVPAGNELGKDFVSAFIALWFFLSRTPVKVITTSADYAQLENVLWGEIRRFIQTSKYPLSHEKGGPLIINHMNIRKMIGSGKERKMCGVSAMLAKVAKKGEGMLGHHVTPESGQPHDGVPRTIWIADEASGIDDMSYERADTWADRKLVIGNPYPCSNFFFKGVQGGDLLRKTKKASSDD